MKRKELLSRLDHDRVTATIAAMEKRTSGEIRVYISHRKVRDPRHAAAHQFVKLGMDKTAPRNAILIFVAPESQNYAILGDTAIHAKCGAAFWEGVVAGMAALFKQGQFTEAIIHGIENAGQLLAEHFPAHGAGHNDRPDSVVER